ncbi:thioredoxin family protein [Paenibacillus glycanilyticus]|uniref:Thioredoxin n=1 Tax=Paenibacillus glycanilyticus TaxID=126569 RepID=A0ABQ6GBA9_9BACL|nr:thioredoxin family protein [Paenibacillus glycanilyticus]GLX67800.1 thioredoxin [Paenibacillus glycanilyticus]
MSVTTIDGQSFRQAALGAGATTLVEFGAKWCPPCKVLLPILDELQQEEGERVTILQVDCDESPELASEYGVMSMPTVIVFHNGEPVDKFIGLRPKDVYQQAIARYAE